MTGSGFGAGSGFCLKLNQDLGLDLDFDIQHICLLCNSEAKDWPVHISRVWMTVSGFGAGSVFVPGCETGPGSGSGPRF